MSEGVTNGTEIAEMTEKKQGRPKGSRTTTKTYCTVRLDKSLIAMLKAVSTREGITASDWLSDAVRPILERTYIEILRNDLQIASPEDKTDQENTPQLP